MDSYHRQQIEITLERLRRGRWCAFVAPRYSGKSTLAGHLVEAIHAEHPAWRVARVKFHEVERRLEEAWRQIAIVLGMPQMDDLPPEDRAKGFPEKLDDFILSVPSASSFCLILDQLDELPDEVLRLLAGELRRYYDDPKFRTSRERFRCLLLGADKLHYVSVGANSPLQGVVEMLELPDLSAAQSAELFSQRHGTHFTDDAGILFAETAGHPYLVDRLAQNLEGKEPAVDALRDAATRWSWESASLHPEKLDECFLETVRYLERWERAFLVVVALLEPERERAVPWPADEKASLCGAIRQSEGRFAFRGEMFQRALTHYFDDLRMADYFCLHGNWDEALVYYGKVSRAEIRKRRTLGSGDARARILDLYLGLTPVWLLTRGFEKAVRKIAETGCHLFGGDHAAFWEYPPSAQKPRILFSTDADRDLKVGDQSGVVSAAVRHGRPQTLRDNEGIVHALGSDPTRSRWALEIQYDEGLPGDWVRENLQFVAPTLYAVLDQVQRGETEETQDRARRSLIHEISLALQGTRSVQEVLSLIVDGVRDSLPYECAQLSLVFEQECLIRAVQSNGAFERIGEMTVRDLNGTDILAEVVRSHLAKVVPDCLSADSQCDQKAIRLAGLKSQAVVPMMLRGKVIGTLVVGDSRKTDAFTMEDAELLQLLADQAAIAIEMAQQREALELALEASGDAMVMVDTAGLAQSCNRAYIELFNQKVGEPAPLSEVDIGPASISLVQTAFRRHSPVQTLRHIAGRDYIVTAASLTDAFRRYAGGVEVIGTKSPLYGLIASFSDMVQKSTEADLGQAIVDALHRHFSYPRVRLYRATADGIRLYPGWCVGDEFRLAQARTPHQLILRNPHSLAVLRSGKPIIVVRKHYAEKGLPVGKETTDSQQRQVIVLNDCDCEFLIEMGKNHVNEWMELPLGTLAKISIDLDGQNRHFGQEDIELMSFFSQWAANALARVIELDRAKKQNKMFRQLGEREGLEAVAMEYLISITRDGGPAFSRAALFVRQPNSQSVRGFLCHGEPNGKAWQSAMDALRLGDAVPEVSGFASAPVSPVRDKRTAVLQNFAVRSDETGNPFAEALAQRRPLVVENAAKQLRLFYENLEWEPAEEALICPLLVQDDCEGLVYLDYAFISKKVRLEDVADMDSTNALLASALHVNGHAEMLKEQVRGLAHSSISPMATIQALAETLRTDDQNGEQSFLLDLIIAESRRATDVVRCLMRAAELSSQGGFKNFTLESSDISELIHDSVRAYKVLIEADGARVTVEMPEERIAILADKGLLGIAFAELAANAMMALKEQEVLQDEKFLHVAAKFDSEARQARIVFSNSGKMVFPQRRSIFEPYVSGTGGTGLGLWLVKSIIEAHSGRISEPCEGKSPTFEIDLPIA